MHHAQRRAAQRARRMWHRLRGRRAGPRLAADPGRCARGARERSSPRRRRGGPPHRRRGGPAAADPGRARAGAVVRSGAGLPPGRERPCADRERVRAGGHRARRLADGPGRPRCARRHRAREPAVDRAARPAAAVRALRRRGRDPCLSSPPPRDAGPGRVRGLALVPDGHLQGALRGRPAWRVLPRASSRGRSRCRSRSSTSASRPTRARRGSGRSRSGSSATTARSTPSTATCGR